jgi:uncharacterized protein YdhG (YjbR/CyaY superfamily)
MSQALDVSTGVSPVKTSIRTECLSGKSKRMTTDRPTSVDEYLAGVPSDDARASLLKLRAIIREEVPEASEIISYGIPTFKLKKFAVSYAAFKNHCSFFPGYTVRDFTDELKGYKTSKGTIQFPNDQPLPEALVRAIVRARLAEYK